MNANQHVIHIVDDDPAIRDALTVVFELEGFSVREFDDGESFLAAMDGTRPNCVIMDVHMPGQSGIEILRRLHATGLRRARVRHLRPGGHSHGRGGDQAWRA